MVCDAVRVFGFVCCGFSCGRFSAAVHDRGRVGHPGGALNELIQRAASTGGGAFPIRATRQRTSLSLLQSGNADAEAMLFRNATLAFLRCAGSAVKS